MTIHPSFIASAIAESVIRYKAEMIDSLSLVSIPQAAKMLDVSTETARKLVGEFVDVGGTSLNITLSPLKRIIEERTISQ